MDGGGRVTKHFFMNSEVDRISNRNVAFLGLLAKTINVGSDGGHLLIRDCTGIHNISESRSGLSVVVSIRGIRILKLLGEFHRRHGGLISKLDSSLHLSQDFFLCCLELILSEHSIGSVFFFELLDRVLVSPGPGLLVFASTLVLRIGRRVTIETVCVDLEDGWPLSAPDIIDHSLSSFGNISGILPINMKTWDTIVLSLLINFAIGGNITSESVDSASIIDDNKKKGEVILSS
mmetsp:Transcript_12891/g.27369  ORF Transcript_12891/g.27369 Transcript_12891/m.27369 type:complete len:234 (+) Transcript_12891:1071-1772(+)